MVYSEGGKRKYSLSEFLYFTYFSLLRCKVLHDLLLLKEHQCDIVKLHIKTLNWQHYTHMPVMEVSHVQQNGKQDFTVNLYLEFLVLFVTNQSVCVSFAR